MPTPMATVIVHRNGVPTAIQVPATGIIRQPHPSSSENDSASDTTDSPVDPHGMPTSIKACCRHVPRSPRPHQEPAVCSTDAPHPQESSPHPARHAQLRPRWPLRG
ncbi:hypothetical protein H257_04089 [Aphanomyces astaci]|uniref:Uncharacterized protein n=1 Tax=Aphanomyces astaci TaxID=112090 RepID=W4GWP2_APHAT|nr:hypothetical protein H257_04089 [Aphanomyces astaci]ETV83338.1 hypothetical protein H257_04089 [Aphanomyces astaci]|eukprot:XP_009826768.1 hypothetical protein H257_04089 [Aphanomyces astaci]